MKTSANLSFRRLRVGAAVRLTQATSGPFKELSGVGRQIGA